MKAFTVHKGLVAHLDRINVDTDQIIPKQFLKRIERTGYGQFLFHDWRFQGDGSPNPDFELNHPHVRDASILLAGANFGCGSSREHAPWALMDYGFRCIVAPSFSDIFYSNCFQNGLLAVRLEEAQIRKLFETARSTPGYALTVDLHQRVIQDDQGLKFSFEMDPFLRECLLHGLDEIGLTLLHEEKILEHERQISWKKTPSR